MQQKLVRPADLRAVALGRPTLPRRALILETVGDVEGGSHSLPELEFLRGLRRAGLPEPTRQRVVRRPDGRYYLDADFDAYRVAEALRSRGWRPDDVVRRRLERMAAATGWELSA